MSDAFRYHEDDGDDDNQKDIVAYNQKMFEEREIATNSVRNEYRNTYSCSFQRERTCGKST